MSWQKETQFCDATVQGWESQKKISRLNVNHAHTRIDWRWWIATRLELMLHDDDDFISRMEKKLLRKIER